MIQALSGLRSLLPGLLERDRPDRAGHVRGKGRWEDVHEAASTEAPTALEQAPAGGLPVDPARIERLRTAVAHHQYLTPEKIDATVECLYAELFGR